MNVLPLGKKLTIAIDIDGTVAECSQVDFQKVDNDSNELMNARPIPGAVEAVKKLHREGHTIVFYTSRSNASKAVTNGGLKNMAFRFITLR